MVIFNNIHTMTLDDFKNHNNILTAQYLYNIYTVINQLNYWNKLKDEKPKDTEGYAYTDLEWVHQIADHQVIQNDGHTGASFALCMRHMEYIAEYG